MSFIYPVIEAVAPYFYIGVGVLAAAVIQSALDAIQRLPQQQARQPSQSPPGNE